MISLPFVKVANPAIIIPVDPALFALPGSNAEAPMAKAENALRILNGRATEFSTRSCEC
jgi:hypothetical protein